MDASPRDINLLTIELTLFFITTCEFRKIFLSHLLVLRKTSERGVLSSGDTKIFYSITECLIHTKPCTPQEDREAVLIFRKIHRDWIN